MKKIIICLLLVSGIAEAQLKDCSGCQTEEIERYLTGNETVEELSFLKNEIYARNGYEFSKAVYRDYFSAQSWYTSLNNNALVSLNRIEQTNVMVLNRAIKNAESGIVVTKKKETVDFDREVQIASIPEKPTFNNNTQNAQNVQNTNKSNNKLKSSRDSDLDFEEAPIAKKPKPAKPAKPAKPVKSSDEINEDTLFDESIFFDNFDDETVSISKKVTIPESVSLIASNTLPGGVIAITDENNVIVSITDSKYLTMSIIDVNRIFNTEKKQELGIDYSIFKVYKYSDKSGKYYLVLTEKPSPIKNEKQVSIKAINFKILGNGKFKKTFEITDNLNPKETDDIHFYTRFILTEDLDIDGLVDPIIVYGDNSGAYCCGTTKMVIHYKGNGTTIRVKKSEREADRYIQIDKSFYYLPEAIQVKVLNQLTYINSLNHIYFPDRYKKKIINDRPLRIEE